VQDVLETHSFAAHLDVRMGQIHTDVWLLTASCFQVMFPADAPAAWDTERKYKCVSITVCGLLRTGVADSLFRAGALNVYLTTTPKTEGVLGRLKRLDVDMTVRVRRRWGL
jgi:hypothetical protein